MMLLFPSISENDVLFLKIKNYILGIMTDSSKKRGFPEEKNIP